MKGKPLSEPVLFFSVLLFVFMAAVLFSLESQAGESKGTTELDLLLDSFEGTAETPVPEPDAPSPAEPETYSKSGLLPQGLSGYFKQCLTVNTSSGSSGPGGTDWRGLSSLKSEIHLEYNGQKGQVKWHVGGKAFYDPVFRINGRSGYTDEVLDEMESGCAFEKMYVSGMLTDRFGLTLGRQVVVWGKSDNIRVTDVLNPISLREFGYADMEDIRLPVAMMRADLSFQRLNVTAMAIPEIRFNETWPYGSDYYPYDAPPLREDIPSDKFSNAEYALAVNGYFSGWDLSFYYADIYNDTPYLETDPVTFQPVMKHPRLTMLGSSLNAARGDWVFKFEGAHFHGLRFFNVPGREFSRVDVLGGFDFSGFKDTLVTVECANRHIIHFPGAAGGFPDNGEKDIRESIVRITRNGLNDTLSLTGLASWYGRRGEMGSYYRLSGEYDVTDDLELSIGVIFYQSGDLPVFARIGKSDRMYGQAKYSF
jgi:hypothetical protein